MLAQNIQDRFDAYRIPKSDDDFNRAQEYLVGLLVSDSQQFTDVDGNTMTQEEYCIECVQSTDRLNKVIDDEVELYKQLYPSPSQEEVTSYNQLLTAAATSLRADIKDNPSALNDKMNALKERDKPTDNLEADSPEEEYEDPAEEKQSPEETAQKEAKERQEQERVMKAFFAKTDAELQKKEEQYKFFCETFLNVKPKNRVNTGENIFAKAAIGIGNGLDSASDEIMKRAIHPMVRKYKEGIVSVSAEDINAESPKGWLAKKLQEALNNKELTKSQYELAQQHYSKKLS